MSRKVTIYTGQWGDIPLKELCETLSQIGYDGIELACCENHFDLSKLSEEYCKEIQNLVGSYGLEIVAFTNHLDTQCICDRIDIRHKSIISDELWGDGEAEGVRKRAAEQLKKCGDAAKMLGLTTVVGFTGSPIWHLVYSFPPVPPSMIDDGYAEFAARFKPILDYFTSIGVRYALEVHPTEIAFDISSAKRALEAVEYHPAFGFNYDPSHFAYQGVDYIEFIHTFADRIFHVHMKDVWWSDKPTKAGVFGGHTAFGELGRFWDFRSVGRGNIDFDSIIRALNRIGYWGPLSVEWEDGAMDRVAGATESLNFVREIDFEPSAICFDDAFQKDKN